jgi:hypothetical protein
MTAVKGYVVRGKTEDGHALVAHGHGENMRAWPGEPTRYEDLDEAAGTARRMRRVEGCTDVRVFAVAEDGETPLPTYEEALAEIEKIRAALDAAIEHAPDAHWKAEAAGGNVVAAVGMTLRVPGLEQANREAHQAIARMKRREQDIIDAVAPVADGGQYRADIVSAIQRERREKDAALAEVERLRLACAKWCALSDADRKEMLDMMREISTSNVGDDYQWAGKAIPASQRIKDMEAALRRASCRGAQKRLR